MMSPGREPRARAGVTKPAYGLYDTRDKCWMGNDSGPLLYSDNAVNGVELKTKEPVSGLLLARAAVTILNERMRTTRLRARPYITPAKIFKDRVTPQCSAVQAMRSMGIL